MIRIAYVLAFPVVAGDGAARALEHGCRGSVYNRYARLYGMGHDGRWPGAYAHLSHVSAGLPQRRHHPRVHSCARCGPRRAQLFPPRVAGAFLAGALENTIVISPRFAANEGGSCRDTLAANEINWSSCSGETWRSGAGAISNRQITSFDVADEILKKLARKQNFPNLRSIVIAGHSAGGQFVNRYEMANQIHDRLGIPISYVVANPSSYAYLDSLRPRSSAFPQNVAALPPGYIAPPSANPGPPFGRYGDSEDCTTYDTWPYGLKSRTGYTAKQSVEQLRRQLAARPTTYLVGELDILPLYGFDNSCPAMAQGPTRLARGLAFGRYVNENFGAKHTTLLCRLAGIVRDACSRLIPCWPSYSRNSGTENTLPAERRALICFANDSAAVDAQRLRSAFAGSRCLSSAYSRLARAAHPALSRNDCSR